MRQLYALVDCNNMYVSCESAFNPSLHGRPVVCLSSNDGNVVARSPEAKALGIKMGTPWFQLRDLARKHSIVALSSNLTLYGDMSSRVMSILREFAPRVEVYSIDESFLAIEDLSRLWPSPTAFGQAVRQRVLRETTLPVCVGLAGTKTLSKLANHVAKTTPSLNGVCDFSTMAEADLDALLQRLDVSEVWGVGRQYDARLKSMGVATVADLRRAPGPWLRTHFGVVLERTGRELRGQSCLTLEQVAPAKQQIICSRSFGGPVLTLDELGEAVSHYMARAAEKLRAQSSVCGAVHVFIMTSRFRHQDEQYANGITLGLPLPSADTRALTAAALAGLRQIYRAGFEYRKAGVMLMEIGEQGRQQGDLFGSCESAQDSERLMGVVDAMNARFGRHTIGLAAAGIRRTWSARASNVTPRYTTRWDELPIARA